jgi:hypothetical protein
VRTGASLVALAVAAVVAAACGGTDRGTSGSAAVDGTPFSVLHMSHTFADGSRAWDGNSTDGTFTYISAPCNFDAPVNNNATNLATFNARIPGTSSPASTRMQPLEFEVTDRNDDDSGRLDGTITMTVCHTQRGPTAEDDPVPDAEKDRILFDWTADYERTSDEEIVWTGTFEIREGTGPYAGISGAGQLSGFFTCAFRPEDCADLGEFTDLQVVMMGSYEHPDLEP